MTRETQVLTNYRTNIFDGPGESSSIGPANRRNPLIDENMRAVDFKLSNGGLKVYPDIYEMFEYADD